MRTARPILAPLLAALLAACAHAPDRPVSRSAVRAPTISKVDARSMTEPEVKEIVLAQFGDTLTEHDRPVGGKTPKFPLRELWYWTAPISADAPNLCKFQDIEFVFSPAGADTKGASAPMRVSSLAVYDYYILLGDIDPDRPDDLTARERAEFDRQCGARSPNADRYFSASSQELIFDVVPWLQAIRDTPDGDFSRISLECDIGGGRAKEGCASIVKDLGASKLSRIGPCPDYKPPSTGMICARADFDSISLNLYGESGDRLPRRIVAREFIVFWDARID